MLQLRKKVIQLVWEPVCGGVNAPSHMVDTPLELLAGDLLGGGFAVLWGLLLPSLISSFFW